MKIEIYTCDICGRHIPRFNDVTTLAPIENDCSYIPDDIFYNICNECMKHILNYTKDNKRDHLFKYICSLREGDTNND